MAVKKTTKTQVPTSAPQKSTAKKTVEAPTPRTKSRTDSKVAKSTATTKASKTTTVPKTPKSLTPKASNEPVVESKSEQPIPELLSQVLIQQQAIQTQAWLTNEITQLRQQLAEAQTAASKVTSQPAPVVADNSELLAEIDRLQTENAELRQKAQRLDQMTSLLQGGESKAQVKTTATKTTAPKATPVAAAPPATKEKATTKTPVAKKTAPKTPVVKVPASKATIPTPRKTRGGVSILQEAAIADVNRTYKSCWPIVFKIEEWNQKHPTQLAKVSQTMLNKSGVNFSRAKGFMDNYGDLVESYHQQIGLSKANSGKFNEVYEFIRASLGKGKKA